MRNAIYLPAVAAGLAQSEMYGASVRAVRVFTGAQATRRFLLHGSKIMQFAQRNELASIHKLLGPIELWLGAGIRDGQSGCFGGCPPVARNESTQDASQLELTAREFVSLPPAPRLQETKGSIGSAQQFCPSGLLDPQACAAMVWPVMTT
jgi:hypothetical protein